MLRCLTLFLIPVCLLYSHSAWTSPRYRQGEVIVKIKQPVVPQGSKLSVKSLSAQANSNFVSKMQSEKHMNVIGSWSSLNMHHVKVEDGKSVEQSIAELEGMAEVEYVEPNYIVDKFDVGPVEGGMYFSLAQILAFITGPFGMTGAAIQAEHSWTVLSSGNEAVVVAVIDTGVYLSHSVFTTPSGGAIWKNSVELNGTPGVDDDRNGYVDDYQGWNFVSNNNNPNDDEGHGTHVAGIILGSSLDIFHVQSSDVPKLKIMPLKFLDSQGSGATSDAIKAIYYAVNNGAKVLNNSWGGGGYSQALAEAIAYSYDRDAVFVAASGNSRNNNDGSPTFPASYDIPSVISVAASDDYDYLAYFSNFGVSSVHLASPGVSILSTYLNDQYAYLSGTSMAAPFVSGIVGMMRYERSAMNNYQIKNLLMSGANVKSNLSGKVKTSARVNAYNGVNLAKTTAVDPFKPGFMLSVSPHDRGLASSMASRGGGCGTVATINQDFWKGRSPQDKLRQIMFIVLLVAFPFVVVNTLRKRVDGRSKRRFERYELNSSVSFKVGDQELMGSVRTISIGGSDLNTDALLSEGSIIKMVIASPDGKSKLEVEGHVVWSQAAQRYGVAFDNVTNEIRTQINSWSKGLQKAS